MSAKLFGLKIGRGLILESIFAQVEICLDNSPRELVISSRGFGASRQPLETPNGFQVFTFHVFLPPHKLASISVEVGGKNSCGKSPGRIGLRDFVPWTNVVLAIRPVNFVISSRVGGESRSHWKLPMVFEFRQIDDSSFYLNSPRF